MALKTQPLGRIDPKIPKFEILLEFQFLLIKKTKQIIDLQWVK